MSVLDRNPVSQNTGQQRINDISQYISIVEADSNISAIDEFYKNRTNLLRIADTPDKLQDTPGLGNLLFLGIMSITENYFRNIISEVIRLCPISKSASSNQSVNLGSIIWHEGYMIEKGSLENLSFADVSTIKSTFKKFLNIDIKNGGEVQAALDEYEKICQLRHAVVHSDGYLAGKNAVKLGLQSNGKKVKINIKYRELQEIALICTSLIASVNIDLFCKLISRWASEWNNLPSWDVREDNKKFNAIWKLFYSEIDADANLISNIESRMKFRNSVKREFNRS